ncbi:hypothetical protein NMY22_g24 [Coprinellus aureogranulatus]|nr:hypothetical protein NMY22_g24 [Coprinellus aureogranulatus]
MASRTLSYQRSDLLSKCYHHRGIAPPAPTFPLVMASVPEDVALDGISDWLRGLRRTETSPFDFICQYLSSNNPDHISSFTEFTNDPLPFLNFLLDHPLFDLRVRKWAFRTATSDYVTELLRLSDKDSGFHLPLKSRFFDANHEKRLKRRIKRTREREARKARETSQPTIDPVTDMDVDAPVVEDDGDEQWEDVDELIPEVERPDQDTPEDVEDQIEERHRGIMKMRTVTCLSIMMQSANMRCNSFQMATGAFLHAANTPETACELFSRVGFCTSTTTVDGTTKRLSNDGEVEIRSQGRTFLSLMAFDNLDFEVKPSQPTIEQPHSTLVHLTTATMLPLHPEIKLADLDCADEIWKHSIYNKEGDRSRSSVSMIKLMRIHEETGTLQTDGLTRRQRFNKWKFLHDLVHHGPQYFRRFRNTVGKPEVVEAIPMAKTTQIPMRAMDISPSTPASNAEVLENICRQAGIGDPTENEHAKDIKNRVILVSGDLLTLEPIVPVMGLFHFKMACAEAVWKIFIQPKEARHDKTSFMEFSARIRPRETGRLSSGPAFRPMHELIQHVGIVSRLDCWLEVVRKRLGSSIGSLEDFASKKPTWEDLEDLATILAKEFVEDAASDPEIRSRTAHQRDAQFENALRRQQIFLLYEEITHAMNYGDIGRLETCFMPWAFIFQGCGKHKYAAELVRYLHNVHFVYPEGLKKAIRYIILCNPTEKEGRWRAIDWIVEHNNLYIKRIYSGKFSNRKKSRMIQESVLIEVYKNVRIQFEKCFCLDNKTIRHSPPQMRNTFKSLGKYMQKERAHRFTPRRGSKYSIPDVRGKGMKVMRMGMAMGNMGGDDELEVGDDGELDVE